MVTPFLISFLPESGLTMISAQVGTAPAVPLTTQEQLPQVSGESFNVEDFLNENADILGSEMGGDFFNRVQDADDPLPPEPSEMNPDEVILPQATPETDIPEPAVSQPIPEVTNDVRDDFSITSDDSDGKLPVTKGLPNNPSTGNYSRYGEWGPSLRRDIPVEAYGEDGYGNPFSGAGCDFSGTRSSMPLVGITGPFENVRLYSQLRPYSPIGNRCLPLSGDWFVNGWVSAGGKSESDWPYNPQLGSGYNAINDSPSDFGMDQLYLSFGKEVNRSGCWSVGVRADLLYGTDYILASSLGLESKTEGFNGGHASRIANAQPRWNRNSYGGYKRYGLAMPQAYGEIYAPWLSGFDIKIGHFYAPMGHETVQSTRNFFYTHSYSFNYGMPHTLTGLMGDLKLLPGLSVQAGISQGWDTWEDNKGSIDVVGGVVLQMDPCRSVSFFLNSGDAITDNLFSEITGEFLGYETGKQTVYSLVYQRKFCGNWTWALEHDFGSAKDAAASIDASGKVTLESGNWYSLVNYLYREITPNMTLGFRFEWFKDKNYTRTLGGFAVNELLGHKWEGDNYYDFTLGLNWRVCRNITIRPEVRYDYSDVKMVDINTSEELTKGVFDHFCDSKMWTVGGDVMIEF